MLTGIVLLTRRSSRRGEAAAALRGADWPRGLTAPLEEIRKSHVNTDSNSYYVVRCV
jgi:hypothetical protein